MILQLHVPNLAALGAAKVAELVVRYVTVGEEIAEHVLTVPVVANLVSADEAGASEPDLQVREEILILQAAKARKDAIELADRGQIDEARQVLASAALPLHEAGLDEEAEP